MRGGAVRLVLMVGLALACAVPAGAGFLGLPINDPLCGSTTGTAAGEVETLRVATFNVLHGLSETPDYPTHSTLDARLELQAQELITEEVDLVGMQEVGLFEGAVGHTDGLVVERLAGRMTEISGEAWYWCWHLANPHFPFEPELQPGGGGPLTDVIASMASSNYGSFKEGAAVLSRYPILASEARRLPHRFPLEPLVCPPADVPDCNLTAIFDHRIALWARVDTLGGPTDIIATHLVHGITPLSDVSTFEQAAVILAFSDEMAARHGEPALRFITCDCNVETTDLPSAVQLITSAGWTDTYADQHPDSACAPGHDTSGCTSDQDIIAATATTTSRIDYVFARGGWCPLDITDSRKIADSPVAQTGGGFLWPSDHHGVATDLDVGSCTIGLPPSY